MAASALKSPIISEVLKIAVDRNFNLASSTFASLRATAAQAGVKEQYYGIPIDEPEHLCWVIQWPADMKPHPSKYQGSTGDFRTLVNKLDKNNKPTHWFFPFESADQPRPALVAPVCQFAILNLKPTTVTAEILPSLHKTFTDCYLAPDGGFTGGHWSIAQNDDRMCYYYLGWESRKLHDLYASTPLFDVEIDKLMPHMAGGWAYYVKLKQELS